MPDSMEPKLGRILKIAVPIVISRASYTVMLFINRLFLSRVGKYELAADGQIAKMAATMLRLLAIYTLANSSKLVIGGSLRRQVIRRGRCGSPLHSTGQWPWPLLFSFV